MEDYEYYKDEMKRKPETIIMGQSATNENIMLGRILTWLPRKIISLFIPKEK